jgi:hypothetical protein
MHAYTGISSVIYRYPANQGTGCSHFGWILRYHFKTGFRISILTVMVSRSQIWYQYRYGIKLEYVEHHYRYPVPVMIELSYKELGKKVDQPWQRGYREDSSWGGRSGTLPGQKTWSGSPPLNKTTKLAGKNSCITTVQSQDHILLNTDDYFFYINKIATSVADPDRAFEPFYYGTSSPDIGSGLRKS